VLWRQIQDEGLFIESLVLQLFFCDFVIILGGLLDDTELSNGIIISTDQRMNFMSSLNKNVCAKKRDIN
jgi:hypothetical protein